MDLIALIPNVETQALVAQCLFLAGLLVPLARAGAARTANLFDDKVVAFIDSALAFIPRVKIGK